MKHIKKFNEEVENISIEDMLINVIFRSLKYEGEVREFEAEEGVSLDTIEGFKQYVDDRILDDHDVYNDVGHIGANWINQNMGYIFQKYQENKERKNRLL